MAFVSNTERDAGPTIAGFFFQVNVSILRWLDLEPSQRIELECGEDIDTVESDGENYAEKWLLEQLKRSIVRHVAVDGNHAEDLIKERLPCSRLSANFDYQIHCFTERGKSRAPISDSPLGNGVLCQSADEDGRDQLTSPSQFHGLHRIERRRWARFFIIWPAGFKVQKPSSSASSD
ncbi:MAG TPA: hypothetical protein VK578_14640 [Edaphobacter sp.]|nr:hypothetical protein [Edaphobacter sp.]